MPKLLCHCAIMVLVSRCQAASDTQHSYSVTFQDCNVVIMQCNVLIAQLLVKYSLLVLHIKHCMNVTLNYNKKSHSTGSCSTASGSVIKKIIHTVSSILAIVISKLVTCEHCAVLINHRSFALHRLHLLTDCTVQ